MTTNRKGWIGVDLDGTLAKYDGNGSHTHIGAPVPAMLARVIGWLREGREVRILTARAYPLGYVGPEQPLHRHRLSFGHDNAAHRLAVEAVQAIRDWCKIHVGQVLPVTCSKDYSMIELWDDRAIQVIPNTGRRADGFGEVVIR